MTVLGRRSIGNWAASKSLWYFPLTTGCCGDEVVNASGSRYDLERFGCVRAEHPENADLLFVSGFVNSKTSEEIIKVYSKMRIPKFVIAVGTCAMSGGMFKAMGSRSLNVEVFVPVDVFVPGCPPRPEAVMDGLIQLREKIFEFKNP